MSESISIPTTEQAENAIRVSNGIYGAQLLDNTFQLRLNALLQCTGATYHQVEHGTHGVVRQHHLWQFHTGRSRNPSYRIVSALADFFHVPDSYFFGDARDEEIAYLLPCIGEADRQRIQRMVVELLEQQLFELAGQLSKDND